MLTIRLATRNLFRQLLRNSISMVSIIMGVFVIVAGRGVQGGLIENMKRAQIDSGSGHVMAVPKDYPKTGFRHPVDDAYLLSDDNRSWLTENTIAWTPRIIATPRAIKGRESMRVRLIGTDVTDVSVFPRDNWEVNGRIPQADSAEIMVSATPARLLDLGVGDVLTLEGRTVDGALNAMRYTVTGILTTGNPFMDNQSVILPLSSAGQLLAANGRVTHVAVRLSNRDNTQPFADVMEEELSDADARTWQQESEAMLETQQMRQVFFDILGFSIMLMAAAGIANTVLMAAFERVREIGTLRSMGMQRLGVMQMFAFEGFWMGLLGGVIGSSLGGWLCYHYSQNGIDLASMMAGKNDSMDNIPFSAMLYLEFTPPIMLVAVLVAVLVAMLASIYPAWIASRISPAQAVRAQ